MIVRVVHGDLLDQDVDAIVNAWHRNVIPWWLLLPQGVSGAIKRRASFRSIAFPLIGAGTGGGKSEEVLKLMQDELASLEFDGEVRIVLFRRSVPQGDIDPTR